MYIGERPRTYPIAIMASGEGTTAEAVIRSSVGDTPSIAVGLVITNDPNAGVLTRVERLNAELGLDVATAVINSRTHPGEGSGRGLMTVEESKAITELLESSGICLVALAGYMKRVSGKLLDDWGALPTHLSPYQARMLNTHPGPLPATTGFYGQGVHKEVLRLGLLESEHTVHVVAAGYDMGRVVARNAVGLPVVEKRTVEGIEAAVRAVERTQYPQDIATFLGMQHAYLSGVAASDLVTV
jgi:phosphoribosylglycinamide formyltransferase-1